MSGFAPNRPTITRAEFAGAMRLLSPPAVAQGALEVLERPPMGRLRHSERISHAQRVRLWALVREHGVPEDALRTYLSVFIGIESTSDIGRDHYEELCRWIERYRT